MHEGGVGGGQQCRRVDLARDRDRAEDALPGSRHGRGREPGSDQAGEIGGAEHAAENRDPERTAQLVDRLQRRRSHPASIRGQLTERCRHRGREREAHPQPTSASHPALNRPLEPTLVRAPISNPAARTANPTATATFAPTSRTIRSAGTAPSSSPPIIGNSRRPDPIGLAPSTPWKYWGIVNSTPNIAKIATAARITPHV